MKEEKGECGVRIERGEGGGGGGGKGGGEWHS